MRTPIKQQENNFKSQEIKEEVKKGAAMHSHVNLCPAKQWLNNLFAKDEDFSISKLKLPEGIVQKR